MTRGEDMAFEVGRESEWEEAKEAISQTMSASFRFFGLGRSCSTSQLRNQGNLIRKVRTASEVSVEPNRRIDDGKTLHFASFEVAMLELDQSAS